MKICTTCGAEWPDETKFCPKDGSPLKAPGGEESLVGGILQSYHIIKKLGEGGMGAVYLGEHVKMGRKSAIKVMTQSLAQDPDAIARFNREAANAASINHVNVCAIYDFGETQDGTIFLAMEYIEGEALTDLIKREGPIDLQRAGAILKQTADALQAAHELGIVHRDLKPDNIMIAKARDGSDLVKVVDFGIAKAMSGEEGQDVTRTGLVVGTPEYMSPEQLSGDKLDGRSDVYSLSLVYFRTITGTLPFQADSAQEAMIKRLTDDPARLNDALDGASFPPKLQTVMDRAMERMPSDRYSTANEFAADVLDATVGAPGPTAPPPIDTQGATKLMDTGPSDPAVTEQLKKTRVSEAQATIPMSDLGEDATAEAALAPPATAGPGAAAGQQHTPGTPMPQALSEAPKKKPYLAIAASVVVVVIAGSVGYVTLSGGSAGDPNSAPDTAASAALVPENGDSVNSSAEGEQGTETDPSSTTTNLPGTEQQDLGTQDSNNPNTTSPSENAVSVADILAEFVTLGRQASTESSGQARAAARNRSMLIYDMGEMPDSVRARAAQIVSESYEEQSTSDACTWIDRAITLQPDNEHYRNYKEFILGCPL